MTAVDTLNIAAVLALLPATVAMNSGSASTNSVKFWLLMAVAVAGPLIWTISSGGHSWRTDFSFALWVTVSSSLCVFSASAVFNTRIAQLAPLFLALMTCLAVFAGLSGLVDHIEVLGALKVDVEGGQWIWVHIAISVLTYALLSIAAVASLAAIVQERALKRKTPLKRLSGLPSVLDCEGIVVRFLWLSAAVLMLGIASGSGINLAQGTALLHLDHKTIFVIAALAVILALLYAQQKTGARGRQVARMVLLAYLFVTLAYPGVKFVTGVLLSG